MAYIHARREELEQQYAFFQQRHMHLDMSRGKPSGEQLTLSEGMLQFPKPGDTEIDGVDCRNYGFPDGLMGMRRLFAEIMGVDAENVVAGGNSSLAMMFDLISSAMTHGMFNGEPWSKTSGIKFLCPSPGYDRHFAICEYFGIQMIAVRMLPDGPDMDQVESLVSEDDKIKGIWCVPKYSNPQGIIYSDEVVRRFARLQPAAEDFRIFWDNAYCIHDLTDNPGTLLNLMDECKRIGNEELPYMFASTSKITFAGGGVAAVAASSRNLELVRGRTLIQTIGPDKMNHLRHIRFFGNTEGLYAHMQKHRSILQPKFDKVNEILTDNFAGTNLLTWVKPNGGYFFSVDTLPGCAKRVVELCKVCGLTLTPAGATFPYGKDPQDCNIRIAPTYPEMDELINAMEVFCLCVKLASTEIIK